MDVKNKSKKKKKNNDNTKKLVFKIITYAVILLLILALIYFFSNSGKDKSENKGNNIKYKNNIMQSEYSSYGVIYLKGYAETKIYTEIVSSDSKDDTYEEKYNIVSFYITDILNANSEKEIESWISKDENNKLFVKLGCITNGKVTFASVADDWYDYSNTGMTKKDLVDNYWKILSLDEKTSQKIISSNSNSPIILKLEKLKFSLSGVKENACTTKVTGIEVVE